MAWMTRKADSDNDSRGLIGAMYGVASIAGQLIHRKTSSYPMAFRLISA